LGRMGVTLYHLPPPPRDPFCSLPASSYDTRHLPSCPPTPSCPLPLPGAW
jgi:hypothetical protein